MEIVAIAAIVLMVFGVGYLVIGELRAIASKQSAAPTTGHAQMLPYREPLTPWCKKLENGALLAALYVDGIDGDETDGFSLGRNDALLSKGVRAITPDCAVWFRRRYVKQKGYDRPSRYAGWLEEFFDERRALAFDGRSTYQSRRVVFVAWMPPTDAQQKVANMATVGSAKGDDPASMERARIDAFDRKLKDITEYFEAANARVERVGLWRDVDGDGVERRGTLLDSELHYAATHKWRRFRYPDAALQDTAGLIAAESFRGGFDLKIGDREFALVVVKGFPDSLWPRKLRVLKKLGVEYEVVVRYLPAQDAETLKWINDARAEWLVAEAGEAGGDDFALEQAAQASAIKGQVRRGRVSFGETSVYLVFSSRSRAAVEDAASRAIKLLEKAEIRAFRATTTAESDYMATLPGVTGYASRMFPLHTLNVVNLADLHAESQGRRYTEAPTVLPNTPAITQAISDENEIVRLHWNYSDSMDVFHHARVGEMGSGKSVQIVADSLAFKARMPFAGVTLYDKGRSSYRVTRFMGGAFNDLLAPGPGGMGLALYAGEMEPEDRGALLGILHAITEGFNVPPTVKRDEAMERALNRVLGEDEHIRSHSLLCEVLQDQEGSMKTALSRFKRENEIVGGVLDREQDSFAFSMWNVIEMDRILGENFPEAYRTPILMAIYWKTLRQIRQLKKRLNRYDLYWLIEQDEAHTMMGNEHGGKFLNYMMREPRRQQIVLGLSSQKMAHFTDSPVWRDLKGTIQAWYYYPNPMLLNEEEAPPGQRLRDLYAESGLSPRGIGMVGRSARYRPVYATKGRDLKRIRYDFDDVTLAIIGRTRQSDNARVDEFEARYPETWRWELLKYEGVKDKDVARARELFEAYQERQAFAADALASA